jgi:hypothetical protein
MQRVVPQAACFVVPRVSSWAEFRRARGSRDLDWTTLTSRDRVAVFIPSDVSPQEVRDCLHEEVAQALGPLNDLYRLPDSVFNDDNFHAVLTGFDMLILRTYYDAELANGMTRAEVAARLPGILARLNPGGARGQGGTVRATSRAWIAAIETALGPGTSEAARIQSAERAVTIARNSGWDDTRLGFSFFALGRLTLSRDVERSVQAFQTAATIFERSAPGGIQSAHVDMQMAAFSLSAGRADEALRLTSRALPAASRAENAALLATLQMIRAEALDDVGPHGRGAGGAPRQHGLGPLWLRLERGGGRAAQRGRGAVALRRGEERTCSTSSAGCWASRSASSWRAGAAETGSTWRNTPPSSRSSGSSWAPSRCCWCRPLLRRRKKLEFFRWENCSFPPQFCAPSARPSPFPPPPDCPTLPPCSCPSSTPCAVRASPSASANTSPSSRASRRVS